MTYRQGTDASRLHFLSRRSLIWGALGIAAAIPWRPGPANAQGPAAAAPTDEEIAAALPLTTGGLEHIGSVVPDVAAAGAFLGRVFNPYLYKEREDPLRYYVTLDPGYIALGSRDGEPRPFFDHDCALIVGSFNPSALARRLEAEGLPPGRFGIVSDPDGLGLQLLPIHGLAASTEPAGRIVAEEPLVRPRGIAHVVRYVSDMERSIAYYRLFFGPEHRSRDTGRVWFDVAHTRMYLEPVPAGEMPRIDRLGVNVNASAFDHRAVARSLADLGATVISADERRLHFESPEGLGFELLPIDPARIWGR
jgi:catechol 2,3-dioxygenase-like lactoylglutathione lyase family enzyme